MASEGLHEDRSALPPEVQDRHRAISSLMEELEAVDWYDQRIEAAADPELKAILAHHRDEEKEHAAMLLEWLRRRDAGFAEALGTYLFTEGSVLEVEEHATGKTGAGPAAPRAEEPPPPSVGNLRGHPSD